MAGCADVCLDYGYDYEGTFFYERLVVSRKSHVCCECGLAISRGDAYWMARGADEGSILRWKEELIREQTILRAVVEQLDPVNHVSTLQLCRRLEKQCYPSMGMKQDLGRDTTIRLITTRCF